MVRTERRYFLTAAGALVAASLTAEAQAPVKIARIGYMDPGLPDTAAAPFRRDCVTSVMSRAETS